LGKPLIHYTLDAALHCPLIEAVYVSTDDAVIAETAHQCAGVTVIDRPAELATDTATTQQVITHFLDSYLTRYGQWPITLVLLQPTSPLRTAIHLTEAMACYETLPQPALLVSMCMAKPLAWQGEQDINGRVAWHRPPDNTPNRQASRPQLVLNGAIYIASPAVFLAEQMFATPTYPYRMPSADSVDIDTLEDFNLAEFWLTRQGAGKQIFGGSDTLSAK
jgi:CMP-N-acetylneuraminic acid synthetase